MRWHKHYARAILTPKPRAVAISSGRSTGPGLSDQLLSARTLRRLLQQNYPKCCTPGMIATALSARHICSERPDSQRFVLEKSCTLPQYLAATFTGLETIRDAEQEIYRAMKNGGPCSMAHRYQSFGRPDKPQFLQKIRNINCFAWSEMGKILDHLGDAPLR